MMSWYFRQLAPALAGGAGSIVLSGFAPRVTYSRVVLRLGERGEASCAPKPLCTPLPVCWLDPSTTSPRTPVRSPCLSCETCTSFQANDTIWYAGGTVGQDNVFTRSWRQKAISISLWWFFFFIKHNNDEVMERLYCSRAKTHYSCQTSEYKRNYKMAFCTRSQQIAGLGDWGRENGKEEERESGRWSVSISRVKVRRGKGLMTTQNTFCVHRIWLPGRNFDGVAMLPCC